ncbi:carbohydrate kinase [Streptomyces sp. N2-109]|uniref:Carbohydrate kinase n=1 Tax=Streptomyces gossypii TaxID=2883101 RepID=A0ABT2JXN5_9ACTN|nr:carbohydrate kinase [Streptomyces gossypii]MCT2592428.1 carbohydrate kinase [Streptomyces gossypii]
MTVPVPAHPAPSAPIAVVGECVADAFVSDTPRAVGRPGFGMEVLPGGGPANTAVALARLGTPTRFVGRLSRDVFGRMFRDRLRDSGVELDVAVAADGPSTLAVADLDGAGGARYSFHAEGAADWQWTVPELTAAVRDTPSCLHTGSLTLVRPPGAAAVEEVLGRVRPHTTVSIDPNVRPALVDPAVYRARIARWSALADILRLSDDDLGHLLPGTAVEDAAEAFHGYGARLVLITLGGQGVFASLDGHRLHVPAPRVRVVDSVGAGDAFMAGVLHKLHRDGLLGGRLDGLTPERLRAALTVGSQVAATVCTVRGADLPPPVGD